MCRCSNHPTKVSACPGLIDFANVIRALAKRNLVFNVDGASCRSVRFRRPHTFLLHKLSLKSHQSSDPRLHKRAMITSVQGAPRLFGDEMRGEDVALLDRIECEQPLLSLSGL